MIGEVFNNGVFALLFFGLPCALFYACAFSALNYIMLPLLFSYYLINSMLNPEKRDGKPWEAFARYFPPIVATRKMLSLRVELPQKSGSMSEKAMEEHLDSEGAPAYVMGVHPHGVAADYRVLMEGMFYDAFPALAKRKGWRVLAANVLFQLPIVREISLWTGCVDAGRRTAARTLSKGRTVVVIPGGEAEQLRTKFGEERIYLKKRFGFVSLAVEHGASLVPMYVFGCTDLYYTSSALFGLRDAIRKHLKVCIPIFWGDFGLSPRRVKTTIVVGDPIPVARMAKPPKDAPAAEQDAFRSRVQQAHSAYVAAVKALFDEHKGRLGYGDRTLYID